MKDCGYPETFEALPDQAAATALGHRLDGSPVPGLARALQRIGVAADHGGLELMRTLARKLRETGYDVVEFGDRHWDQSDDYPDFVIPLAEARAV